MDINVRPKVTSSQLNLPHGTKQKKSNEETKNKKPVSIDKAGRVNSCSVNHAHGGLHTAAGRVHSICLFLLLSAHKRPSPFFDTHPHKTLF